jgi:PBSX family phage terminase large subunit
MQVGEIILPKQFAPLMSPTSDIIVEDSGRSSGKSTTNEMAAVLDMLASRYNNIWYCRAESGDLRKTVFSSMWATIQSMGLAQYFRASLSPVEITCTLTGSKCYFSGINGKVEDDLNATKGFTPQFRTLKRFILDEANEVRYESHITAAETTANKFLIDGSKIIYAYNPPPLKTHYSHAFFADKIRNGAKRIYTTWEDIYQLLKPATIQEIKRMKENDPLFYRYWYLGEVVNFSGMVYPQFKRERHCISIYSLLLNGDSISELILGLDEGTVSDSTCVTPLAIMMSGKAVVMDFYEYSPKDRTKQQGESGSLSPSEQARRIYTFMKELFVKFPMLECVPRIWIFECAEGGQMLRFQFAEDYGEPTCLVENKSIWGDVKRVRNMLSEDVLFFHMAPNVNTEILIQDIESYVIDEKTNDIKKDQRDDSIDSLEYATKLYFDRPINKGGY